MLNNIDKGLQNDLEHILRTFGWTLSTSVVFCTSSLSIWNLTIASVKLGFGHYKLNLSQSFGMFVNFSFVNIETKYLFNVLAIIVPPVVVCLIASNSYRIRI